MKTFILVNSSSLPSWQYSTGLCPTFRSKRRSREVPHTIRACLSFSSITIPVLDHVDKVVLPSPLCSTFRIKTSPSCSHRFKCYVLDICKNSIKPQDVRQKFLRAHPHTAREVPAHQTPFPTSRAGHVGREDKRFGVSQSAPSLERPRF